MMSSDQKETPTFGIITLAMGEYYHDLALVLVESLKRYMPDTKVAVVADGDFERLGRYFDEVIPINLEHGTTLKQKLFLNEYSPFEKTLFIDADSIALRSFQGFVDHLIREKYAFTSSLGYWTPTENQQTEWFHDAKLFKEKTEFEEFHCFHGGLYFWDHDASQDWFRMAREFNDSFDESWGLTEVPGHGFNEEIAFGCVAASLKEKTGFDHYQGQNTNHMTTSYYSTIKRGLLRGLVVRSRKSPYKKENPALFHFFHRQTKKPIYRWIKKKAFRALSL